MGYSSTDHRSEPRGLFIGIPRSRNYRRLLPKVATSEFCTLSTTGRPTLESRVHQLVPVDRDELAVANQADRASLDNVSFEFEMPRRATATPASQEVLVTALRPRIAANRLDQPVEVLFPSIERCLEYHHT